MRQIISSGSVKAIYLDREAIINELKKTAEEAFKKFPEIKEVILFGSLAKGEHCGLSDIDVLIVAESKPSNPLERMKPYFDLFAERLKIAIDLIVITPEEKENFKEILKEGLTLLTR